MKSYKDVETLLSLNFLRKLLIILIVGCFVSFDSLAQLSPSNDACSSSTKACVDETIVGTNFLATSSTLIPDGTFCIDIDNPVWYNFSTTKQGGDVTVTIANIECIQDATKDNELQAFVFEATDPCDPTTFNLVSTCETNAALIQLTALGLAPETSYYILVDGDRNGPGIVEPAECSFNIVVSGPGVDIEVDASEDKSLGIGQSVLIDAKTDYFYQWTPTLGLDDPISLTPTASPEQTTTYTLVATSVDNCSKTDNVTITVVSEVKAANVITPNGDGINDTWIISNIEPFPNSKISVYTRWGQRIFNTVGYSSVNRWDGTGVGSAKLPTGTYYYVIDLNEGSDKDQQIIKGFVTIIY